jgi:hypothetical protein
MEASLDYIVTTCVWQRRETCSPYVARKPRDKQEGAETPYSFKGTSPMTRPPTQPYLLKAPPLSNSSMGWDQVFNTCTSEEHSTSKL